MLLKRRITLYWYFLLTITSTHWTFKPPQNPSSFPMTKPSLKPTQKPTDTVRILFFFNFFHFSMQILATYIFIHTMHNSFVMDHIFSLNFHHQSWKPTLTLSGPPSEVPTTLSPTVAPSSSPSKPPTHTPSMMPTPRPTVKVRIFLCVKLSILLLTAFVFNCSYVL